MSPLRNATSVPTFIWAKIFAWSQRMCLLGSIMITSAPFLTAFLRNVAATGWASAMFVPMQTKSFASPKQRKEFVIAPEPNVVARPATVGACQVRAQWSMLLVPITDLKSFCML